MSKDTECPYCGEDVEINHDDGYGYEESQLHEQECQKCGKLFAYTTAIMLHHTAYKADCLNGGAHNYKPVVHAPRCWPAWVRCADCGQDIRGQYVEPANAQSHRTSRASGEGPVD